ncbi:hypothetical protein BOTBODRAFT_263701 [Botryobasidium botryosum FD-172 SS1]|uniref:Uncharacterized protein n=1 Tax=Botryobasidium botryosum (strain FD-172 SS1) TaxID=930990 RepID=A0A067M2Y9_BOTB1|nr:hypothetical protein BOTBODRAFT_263701 [Botryobasidium botryosum FD-172 SS1]
MREIAGDLTAIKYHTKKIDILRSHCESTLNEIKHCQHSEQLSATLKRFTGLWTVFQPVVRSWESLDSSESYLRQFTVTQDIEAILKRLDTFLADNNIASRLPPRSWGNPFAHAVMEDSDSLVCILKQQEAGIWNTVHNTVLDSVLIKYPNPSSSAEQAITKILSVLGITLQMSKAEAVTNRYQMAIDSVNSFVLMVDAFAEIHPYAKAASTALSTNYEITMAKKDPDDELSGLLKTATNPTSCK